jgi:NADH-quinone oxidoreductase subunit E
MSMSVNQTAAGAGNPDKAVGTAAEQEVKIISGTEKILAGFKGEKSEAIPILQQVQLAFGYLPWLSIEHVARFVKVPECTLFGVATFYAQFKLTPTGKNLVRVCRGTACHVKGGAGILKEVEKRLGIKPGQNTPDMEYALETVACIGACALAPTMTINNEVHGEMTSKKVAELLPNKMEEKHEES